MKNENKIYKAKETFTSRSHRLKQATVADKTKNNFMKTKKSENNVIHQKHYSHKKIHINSLILPEY
jgi:hypothetical protein